MKIYIDIFTIRIKCITHKVMGFFSVLFENLQLKLLYNKSVSVQKYARDASDVSGNGI